MTNNEAAKIIELNNRYRRGEIDFHQIGYTVFINSSDYSTIYEKGNCVGSKCTKVISFYYGYEHRENGEYDGQYLFVAKIDGNVINSYTKSQIEENSTFKLESMSDYLQVGIFMHLNDFKQ